jgi:hypothetical protein
VYKAYFENNKLPKNSRICIQHINIKKFLKSENKSISLKFATVLKTLGTDANHIKASVNDYMSKFVYTIQWQDQSGCRSSIMRTCQNVFDYVESQVHGAVIGIGARTVDYGQGYKILIASEKGYFEEKSLSSKTQSKENDLVRDSLKASSYRGSSLSSHGGKFEKMVDKDQEEVININFVNFQKALQD